jgi:hypothetical protein
MKKLITLTAALLFCIAPYAVADDSHSHDQSAKADKLAPETGAACPKAGMGMMEGGMSPDLKKKMQEQMSAIRKSNDPAEQRKLMQEAMQALRGKAGISEPPCAQNCPKPLAGDCQKRDSCPPPSTQQRMDMMQSMMENMLEHQRQMQQIK